MSWLKRLVGKRDGSTPAVNELLTAPFEAPLLPAEKIAVIGDIHGRDDLLEKMLKKLASGDVDTIVFVGDYVDRGDDSDKVLLRLKNLQQEFSNVVCIKGNHEKMLLDFIDRPVERGERWLRNGGLQTLASYGMNGVRDTMSGNEAIGLSQDFRAGLPEGMEDWIRNLPLTFRSGNIWVVHAAADPEQPIEDQGDRILLWGHRNFRRFNRLDGNWVIHGHTIVPEPTIIDGKIALDTGAYATGILTAALISPDVGEPIRFITA